MVHNKEPVLKTGTIEQIKNTLKTGNYNKKMYKFSNAIKEES